MKKSTNRNFAPAKLFAGDTWQLIDRETGFVEQVAGNREEKIPLYDEAN